MRLFIYFGVFIAAGLSSATAQEPKIHGPATAQISVCFVPYEHCSDQIVASIDGAKTSILVQAYELTAKPILEALIRAKGRGIDVKAILDYRQMHADGTGAKTLSDASIPVWIDHPPRIAHNKLIIIDETLVIGGSYNYTTPTETEDAENVPFVESVEVAGWYIENWQARQGVSKPYQP